MSHITLLLASCIYVYSLLNLLARYASVQWDVYGYSYGGIDFLDSIALITALTAWVFVLPKKIDRPSSFILIIVYIFVCLPAIVAMVGFENMLEKNRYILLVALVLGFGISCLLIRGFEKNDLNVTREYSSKFILLLILSWYICLASMLYSSIGIMSFAGLDSIYEQREIGAAKNLFEGYVQTYFGYVFSPALLTIGLQKKKYIYIVLGCLGAVLLYLVTAEKAVITYPIFIAALFHMLKNKNKLYSTAVFILLIFSIFLLFGAFFHESFETAEFIAWYLGVRTLLTPGAFIVHYADYFSETGYTYFTHISGVSNFIDIPTQYLASARWPSIGHLVGEDYLNIPTLNANANFMASDGIASAGIVGLFFSLILFAIFLIILDRVAKGVSATISLPILLPIALTLTNGSLFTVLLSFGGLFWIISFKLFFDKHY